MSVESPQILPLLPPTQDATDWAIPPAAGVYVGQWQDDLGGCVALTAQLRFLYGSGGSSVTALVQTSLDQGNSAIDIALVAFGTASRTVVFCVNAATTGILLPGSGGLTAGGGTEVEGLLLPVLGDRFRLQIAVTGTYIGSILSARIMAS